MRYAYQDLGRPPAETAAIVRWSGGAADVFLLDPVNFVKYREGRGPIMYSAGGHFSRPPAQLTVPEEGRWYVVADLRGYPSQANPTVEVVKPGDGAEQQTNEEALAVLR